MIMQTANDLLSRDKQLTTDYVVAKARALDYTKLRNEFIELHGDDPRWEIEHHINQYQIRIDTAYAKMDSILETQHDIADSLKAIRLKGY